MDRLDQKETQIRRALQLADREQQRDAVLVGDIMTPAPATVSITSSVIDLVRALQKFGFRHLLVVHEDGTLAGVLSDRDVIRCFGPDRYPDEKRLSRIAAEEIMSPDVITASVDTPVETAVGMMMLHGISCLPIVQDEKVVGIVTNTDLHVLLQVLLTGRKGAFGERATHALRA